MVSGRAKIIQQQVFDVIYMLSMKVGVKRTHTQSEKKKQRERLDHQKETGTSNYTML